MFLAQRLAIGLEGHQHVVQRLFDRDRAAVRGRIRAFDIDPLALGLDAGLVQQRLQRDADIFHVVDHALGELHPVQLRPGPFHPGVRRAFAEIDPGLARETGQVVIGEDQRPVDQPVDHQPVVGLGQLDGAGMVPLEGAAGGGNGPVQLVNRGEVDRADRVGGQPRHVAAHHLILEVDRHAVGRGVHAVARVARPVLHLGDQGIGRARGSSLGPRGQRPGRQRHAGCDAGAQQAAARGGCGTAGDIVAHLAPHYCLTVIGEVSPRAGILPSLRICDSTTSQICGPSVPSLTEAQPATT